MLEGDDGAGRLEVGRAVVVRGDSPGGEGRGEAGVKRVEGRDEEGGPRGFDGVGSTVVVMMVVEGREGPVGGPRGCDDDGTPVGGPRGCDDGGPVGGSRGVDSLVVVGGHVVDRDGSGEGRVAVVWNVGGGGRKVMLVVTVTPQGDVDGRGGGRGRMMMLVVTVRVGGAVEPLQ